MRFKQLGALLLVGIAACASDTPAASAVDVRASALQASGVGGSITRSEVLARANSWLDNHAITYSQSDAYPDRDGRLYRRDCSGFASMALHASQSYNTVSFVSSGAVTRLASQEDLAPGDLVGIMGPDTGGDNGHVMVFVRWADSTKHGFTAYEQSGEPDYPHQSNHEWPISDSRGEFRPYRYTNIVDDPAGGTPPVAPAISDGSLVREPNGTIAVMAGGAAFSFTSMDELNAHGFGNRPWTDVSEGFVAAHAGPPSDGALLRDPLDGGSIAVVVHAAALWIRTWDDYLSAGYGPAAFVNVPRRYIDALPHSPADGSLLRDRNDGSISVVAGGAAVWIQSWQEYLDTGYGAFTNVPRRIIDELPRTVRDGTLLRDPRDGTLVHIKAGTRYTFASWQQYVDAGFESAPFVNVPRRVIEQFPSRPTLD